MGTGWVRVHWMPHHYRRIILKFSAQNFNWLWCLKWSESCSVMSNSLWSHGLYSPWNSSSQNTGVGSYSLLQGIFPTQGSNPGLWHCRWILYQLSHYGDPKLIKIPQAVDAPLSLNCNNFSKSLYSCFCAFVVLAFQIQLKINIFIKACLSPHLLRTEWITTSFELFQCSVHRLCPSIMTFCV